MLRDDESEEEQRLRGENNDEDDFANPNTPYEDFLVIKTNVISFRDR